MPTNHDSIVGALRLALAGYADVPGWAVGTMTYDGARELRAAIPAVESLVAENARLREALSGIRTWADKPHENKHDALLWVYALAGRALKGDD
jgi:hypothetical protein